MLHPFSNRGYFFVAVAWPRALMIALVASAFAPTAARANTPPQAPVITEPAVNGQIVNPSDVHMETGPFADADPGDTHLCTDWEIWTVAPSQRVWFTSCIGGVERVHSHLGDGTFENSHAGRQELFFDTAYRLQARHRDDSGVGGTDWSPWSERFFTTGPATQIFPLELDDILDAPQPQWQDASAADIALPVGAALRLESGAGEPLLVFSGTGSGTSLTNAMPLAEHVPARLRLTSSVVPVALPESDVSFVTDEGSNVTLYLPPAGLTAGQEAVWWLSATGSTYVGDASQTEPDFSILARGAPVPFIVNEPGYVVEVVASGFQLPVNIAFVPNPGLLPGDPKYYVTELYGIIKVVTNDGQVSDYATGLLNFNPTGAFPGSGEQGLAGIVVHPVTGDVYVSLLYDAGGPHHPRIVRFHSNDGGLTAATQTIILDMAPETQGQSHQISHLSIGPDGYLYVHMGDGFDASTAQNLNSFRGKILRVNLSGTPVTTNPFYNVGDGISPRDYVYAYGVRNPFGGVWRAEDNSHYIVENGPSVDRITKLVAGRNYLWNGSNASMQNFAIYNWEPSVGPVNMAFIEPSLFGGSGFPAGKMGRAYISESGPTWGTGPQSLGKRITEWVLDANGDLVSGPTEFVSYNGSGKATVVALAAGPDGLYFSDFYKDQDYQSPIDRGSNILRVRFVGSADFTADVTSGQPPLSVQFTDTSTVNEPIAWSWDFGDGGSSTEQHPSHTYNSEGTFTVQLQVTSADGISTQRKVGFIFVGQQINVAMIAGSAPASGADAAIAAHLGTMGYHVSVYDDEPANRPTAAQLAAGNSLVIVSATVLSSNIGAEFRNVAVPLIYWESALNTAQREPLCNQGGTASAQAIDVLNNAHPIMEGIGPGAVQVFTSPATMSYGSPPAGPEVTILATRAGTGDYAVLAADAGDELLGGHIAPARRVFLFFEDQSWLSANETGRQIFEQAVVWTAGAVFGPPTITIDAPVDGQTIIGDDINVAWTSSGNLAAAHHVHVQLDGGPAQMVNDLNGSLLLAGVVPGPHVVTVTLVGSDHQPLPNLEATDAAAFTAVEELPVLPQAVALAYNWNGAVHAGEAGNADAPDGYRSIADRGLVLGQADSLGGADFTVTSGQMVYLLAGDGSPALDSVFLGTRLPNGGPVIWDDVDDNDAFGIAPLWDPTGGTGIVASSVHPLDPPTAPLDSLFTIGILYNGSNGGGSFDVTLGFTDATSVTVRLACPDWFANFNGNAPAPGAGVASQLLLAGPLSGGDGFAGASNIDTGAAGEPLNVVEARVTAASLLADAGFDVTGRRIDTITFDNFSGGSASGVSIFAASILVPDCACAGDLNGDDVRNGRDIQGFVACLLSSGSCTCAEMTGDGSVNESDVSAFVAALLAGTACD